MSTGSTRKTILVALGVSLVCSVLVSSAAVGLKSIQDRNRELDKLKNILSAGNISYDNANVRQLFKEKVKADVIDLDSGTILPQNQYTAVLNPEKFDIKSMAKNQQYNRMLTPDQDLARIKQVPKNMVVYWIKSGSQFEKIILPIYGKGLWSTMYGFIALDRDLKTVAGFTFYEHGETPGLGGEVGNPAWKKSWIGKKVFDESGNLRIEVVKGIVNPADSQAQYQVDGFSGATLTTRGVNNLVHFWLGDNGYGTFLDHLRKGNRQ